MKELTPIGELSPDEAAASLSLSNHIAEKVLLKPQEGGIPQETTSSVLATAEPKPQTGQEVNTESVIEKVKTIVKEQVEKIFKKERKELKKELEAMLADENEQG